MAVRAGYAELPVAPVLIRNFSRNLVNQMAGPATKSATKTGTQAGRTFGQRFEESVDRGDTGRRFGQRFGRSVTPQVERVGTDAGRRFGMRLNKSLGGGFSASAAIVRKGAGLMGAGFALAGVAQFAQDAVDMAATFDKTMRQTAVVAKVPAKQFKELRDVALDMGAKTSFSAQEAGKAMLELGKGGLTFAEQKAGGLSATLTLAAAGSLELGDAAGFVVQGLRAFGLRATKAGTVAAALAGAANASTSSVEDMGLSLSQTAAGARNAGLSIQETTGVLAAFANNGIKGSDAGTSLKTMLARLVPTTAKAKDAMADLGLKFTDARGAMLPITNIAQQLKIRLGGLSDAQRSSALATIFGSDATRAATILMREGASGLAKYIKATSDRGAAEKLAATNTSGAAGAFERLKGAIETVQIRLGTLLLPTLAKVAEKLSVFLSRITSLKPNLDKLTTAWNANKTAIMGMVAGLDSVNGKTKTADERAQSFTDSLATATTGIGQMARALNHVAVVLNAINASFKKVGSDIHVHFVRPIVRAFLEMGLSFAEVNHKMIAGAATVAEALHVPQAKALRRAEQSMAGFLADSRSKLNKLAAEAVSASSKVPGGGNSKFGGNLGRAGDQMVRFRSRVNHEIARITPKKTILVTARSSVTIADSVRRYAKLANVPGFHATGGPIHGPGTGTSDSIPAMLSAGEHVWTAKEVQKAGGHGAVEAMRRQVARGYAGGGPVLDVPVRVTKAGDILKQFYHPVESATRRMGQKITSGFAKLIGKGLSKAINEGIGGGKAGIKNFIKAVDSHPYVWGGVGPGGYDCSGLVGEVYARHTGRPSYRRYFTTSTIGGMGFARGPGGVLQIGVSPGHHMAGRYGGLGFEAESTRTGIKIGAAASPPGSFPVQYHLARGGRVEAAEQLARLGVEVGGDPGGMWLRKDKSIGIFDRGGWLMPGQLGMNRTTAPERVVGPREQLIDYDKLAKAVVLALHSQPLRAYANPNEMRHAIQTVQSRGGVKPANQLK